jgi:hypothetical protein
MFLSRNPTMARIVLTAEDLTLNIKWGHINLPQEMTHVYGTLTIQEKSQCIVGYRVEAGQSSQMKKCLARMPSTTTLPHYYGHIPGRVVYGNDDTSTLVIFEVCVEKETLELFIDGNNNVSITERLDIIRDISHALSCIHSNNIAHGNINPQSIRIRIDEKGKPRAILDGFTKWYISSDGIQGEERPEGFHKLRGDIYLLGVVMIEVAFWGVPSDRLPEGDIFKLPPIEANHNAVVELARATTDYTGNAYAELIMKCVALGLDGCLDSKGVLNEVCDFVKHNQRW